MRAPLYRPKTAQGILRRERGIYGSAIEANDVRARIQTAQLLSLLQRNAFGTLRQGKTRQPYELSISRIKSIEILLRKCLPDLIQADISAEVEHRYIVEMPSKLTSGEWSKKYSPSSISASDQTADAKSLPSSTPTALPPPSSTHKQNGQQ